MDTLDSSYPLRLYLSTANSQLTMEREVAERIALSLSPVQVSHDLADCDVYIGLLGLEHDLPSLTEFEGVIETGKTAMLWVRDAQPAQRDAALNELLLQLQAQPKPILYLFRDKLDFAQRLLGVLEGLLLARQPERWAVPPLPPRLVPFVGRDEALERLASLLNGVQAVAIRGAAGVGKTALALELAYRLRERFSGGVFWLGTFGERGQPFQMILRRLGSAHPGGRTALHEGRSLTSTEVRGWLAAAEGKLLVIADNAPSGVSLRELRAALPTSASLLITVPVGFAETGWSFYDLGPLSPSDSLALLSHHLKLPTTLAEEVMRPLQGIVEILEGYPLSLRLAAGWMQQAGGWQSALVYLKRLTESPHPLPQLRVGADAQPALQRAFGLLYNSLAPRQKIILRAAGIFAPDCPFTAEALLAVADSAHAQTELESLVPFLLSPDEAAGGYRLHEQLQTYLLGLLETEGDLALTRQRYLDFYKAAGAARPDLGQLRHAFEQARQFAAASLPSYTLQVGQYLHGLHLDEEVRRWLDATLEAAAGGAPATPAQREEQPSLMRALGDLCLKIGHTAAAQEYYERALLLYYENKSLSGQANTLKVLGDLHAVEGHREEAQEFYDRTLLLYAQIDFQLGRANTLKSLGDLSLQNGDYAAARDYYKRTLELAEQIDFQLGQAHTHKALGDLNLLEHDLVAARESYRAALNLYTEINFYSQQAATLILLGNLDTETHALDAAQHAYHEALRLYRHLGDQAGQASALEALGMLHLEQQAYAAAKESFEQACQLYHQSGKEAQVGSLNLRAVPAYMGLRDPESALGVTLEALRIFHNLQDKPQTENTRRQLRELARQLGSNFAAVWDKVTLGAALPEWLRLVPSTAIPQKLVYAVRDFMLADTLSASQKIVEQHQDIMLTDEADEVFARMLRQYAGQPGPTRQIDKYRALLQRCRQIGIQAAFAEARTPSAAERDSQAAWLLQSLDAYDEALQRLRDIPLVYASVQINRGNTLRELAQLPRQDQFSCLQRALDAYTDALRYQAQSPLDYAQTQISRAATLRQLAELPGADVAHYLRQTLDAYTDALQYQHGIPLEYARIQLERANTLRQLGELPGQDALAWMREALAAYNEVLEYQRDMPLDYAQTQSSRARLLHEMAGLPGENFNLRMNEALNAYDEALEYLRDEDPLNYARTQTNRVALLRDMAGLPGEERTGRLYQALAACNEALRYLINAPRDYAKLQVNRAALMREIAGLTGEHRLARMREALAIYNEALTYMSESPLEYAAVQNSRAALLRELAGLSGENRLRRLRESLEAASEAVLILEKLDSESIHLRNAQRMTINTRKEIVTTEGTETFNTWWQQIVRAPQPDWLLHGN